MRILVFSDSHGSTYCMREALLVHSEADMIIHLGDGERDLSRLEDLLAGKKIVQVCGNCDFCSMLPTNEITDVSGVRIFCSHGHTELVKHGTQAFVKKAKSLGARIALYGHTHQSVTDYDDGLHIMNPGSIRAGEYGAVDITPSGIMLLQMKV
ncbi:MAG: YfcE family phosphodiesterase [Ruminococcaceae bacterium]|nr:YfcE family phosphodiesterase [Oscillospiraceae bacterium]